MGVQISIFDLDLSFGKTSQELSQATAEKILEPSWKNFVESKKVVFQFLNLTTESGRIAEQSPATECLCVGDLWTLNTSEYLNAEKGSPLSWITGVTTQRTYYYRESRLSEILQTDASEKYYLSVKACEGILRRADKRGKELPEVLKTALENQITHTPLKSGGSDTYLKSDGSIGTAGKGALIQTEQSATLGVSQDQTLFTPTTAYGLGRDSFNSGTNAQFTMSIEEEKQPPITERGAGGVCSIVQ